MLTIQEIKNAKVGDKPRKLYDRDGLYLFVTPTGGKLWRGKYRVTTSSEGVDAVLTGSVKSWTSRPIAFTSSSSETTRAAVTLRASVRFQDLVAGTVPFQDEDYLFTKEYDVVGDPDQYFDTELAAVDDVAEDFARAVVSAILEAF